jgi:hypothetical protein
MTIDLAVERLQLNQSERVRRYVARDMPASEASAFECELLQSLALQADVEAELALREHADAINVTPQNNSSNHRTASAIAASVLLGLGLGFTAGRISLRADGDDNITASALPLVMLTQNRGSAEAISVPAEQIFVARVLTAEDGAHDVLLSDASGKRLRSWQKQQPAADGFLTLLLPALPASQQPYRIEVSAPSQQRFELIVK